jgi:phosphoenolpyruvate carboxylase
LQSDWCLTAHPTQFYPDSVLGIIHDLAKSIADNKITEINLLLQQLGKTPFFKHVRPTPVDEANSLIWYLKNIFYPAHRYDQSTGNPVSTRDG